MDDLAYQELQAYTLTRGDAEFLHQYAIDAWTAQQASDATRPIALTFALMGLFLHTEHGRTGREIQRGHMALARQKPGMADAAPAGRARVDRAGSSARSISRPVDSRE